MIIGLTGTFAAGKDTIADYLVSEKGFGAFGTGDIVREWTKKMDKPNTRDEQRKMGNFLRDKYGADFVVKEALKKIDANNKVISGIRQPNEAEFFTKTNNAYLIAINAPLEERFERMKERNREGDPKTIEELKEKENKEMKCADSNDPGCQNISKCMEMADFSIDNSGSREELYKKIDKIIEKMEKK